MSLLQRKGAHGICALIVCVCFITPLAVAEGSFQKADVRKETPTIEHTPSNGLYWNDRKIAEYPAIFFLHYYFKIKATIPIVITIDVGSSGSINRVEFYINGALQSTIQGPGPAYSWTYEILVTPFHHSMTFTITVVLNNGEEVLNDNVTIYRLFP